MRCVPFAILMAVTCDARKKDWEPFRARAVALVQAAAESDSAGLRELVGNSDVSNRIEVIRRTEPALLSAATGLHIRWGHKVSPDTTYVSFSFPYRGDSEVMDVGFVNQGGRWRAYYLGFPNRM